jgi:hypothetical protein
VNAPPPSPRCLICTGAPLAAILEADAEELCASCHRKIATCVFAGMVACGLARIEGPWATYRIAPVDDAMRGAA